VTRASGLVFGGVKLLEAVSVPGIGSRVGAASERCGERRRVLDPRPGEVAPINEREPIQLVAIFVDFW
jgi:hypothetical protein